MHSIAADAQRSLLVAHDEVEVDSDGEGVPQGDHPDTPDVSFHVQARHTLHPEVGHDRAPRQDVVAWSVVHHELFDGEVAIVPGERDRLPEGADAPDALHATEDLETDIGEQIGIL